LALIGDNNLLAVVRRAVAFGIGGVFAHVFALLRVAEPAFALEVIDPAFGVDPHHLVAGAGHLGPPARVSRLRAGRLLARGLGEGRRRQDGEREAEDRGAFEMADHADQRAAPRRDGPPSPIGLLMPQ
jgi:hypothetical protein